MGTTMRKKGESTVERQGTASSDLDTGITPRADHVSEREARIIDEYRREKEVERSLRKTLAAGHTLDKMGQAVREGIRRLGRFERMLAVVEKNAGWLGLPQGRKVAEVLSAAGILKDGTMPEDLRLGEIPSVAWLRKRKREAKRLHRRFARRARRFLPQVIAFRDLAVWCEELGVESYREVVTTCELLSTAIQHRLEEVPRFPDTWQVRDLSKPVPHTLASTAILAIMRSTRRRQQEKLRGAELHLDTCVRLLRGAGLVPPETSHVAPHSPEADRTERLRESLRKAYRRHSRRRR